MSLESLPDHLRRPHLRPIQPVPVIKGGKALLALRDPTMMSRQTMVVHAGVLPVLQRFRGDRSVQEISAQLSGSVDQIIELAKGLDRVGLLWGPTFERLESELREKLQAEGAFPIRASLSIGKTEEDCRGTIEGYFEQTEDPELTGQVLGIVAPHLDYQRGWPNYAAAYRCVRETEPPQRVVILGTNHFGVGEGVVLSEYGFISPMGRCPSDGVAISKLVERLGRGLIVDQLDHLPEHSVELHLPWLQYLFGNVPVVAALIPDPLAPPTTDDTEAVTTQQFLDALPAVLDELGGRTLFVASSDLSHVGLQFGEPRPVDDQRRLDVERIDRELLAKYATGDPEEFVSAVRWNKNPTRWCSVGNLAATLQLLQPDTVELIDYRQACDERGFALVSSAAIAMMGAA
ncbi:MAG: AmmeMemoRadiSam system protein B [Planctomycetota bacterium]|jgi:AmmeMemoRadiSam system protein B